MQLPRKHPQIWLNDEVRIRLAFTCVRCARDTYVGFGVLLADQTIACKECATTAEIYDAWKIWEAKYARRWDTKRVEHGERHCEHCGGLLGVHQRADAKFCKPRCRVAHHRG